MNSILDEIELRLRQASGAASITVADMIYSWLGDKGYTGTLGQRLGAWGEDRNLNISRVSLVATVPNPPTAVLATGGNGQASVSFSAAYSGGSQILDYTVTASPGDFEAVGTGSPIVVTGLTNGTNYTFVVRARNAIGYSEESAASSATTPATVPEAPSIFSAVAAPSSAIITITAPDDGGSPITGYTVTSDPGGIEASGFSPITVTGLTDGVQYTFTAVAENSIGVSAESAPSAAVISASIPGIPTDVVAVRGDMEVELTWTAPADGGADITEYTINTIPAEFSQTSATNSHTFTGLLNGASYRFEVSATNEVGTSDYSEESNAAIPAGLPGEPNIISVATGNTQLSVTYDAADPNGDVISSYTATTSPGGFNASGLDNPLVITGLTNGTPYTVTITATNSVGTSDASAPSAAATPATVPGAPTIGTATGSDAQASVAFTAPASTGGSAITHYTATASPGGATATGPSSPLVVQGLANGVAHTFTVTATNSAGTSAASAASNSVTPTQSATVPGAPTNLVATVGAGQVTVSFSAPSNSGGSAITGYTVTSSPGGLTATGASSPLTVTGLTNGTAYTFTAYATNGSGNGPSSAPTAAVTPRTVPGAPTIGTAVAGNAQASVAFTAPASNGGSTITGYTATSSPGSITGTGTSSPILVTGLSNGVAYTFTVKATNVVGQSAASSASNSVTPSVPVLAEGRYDAEYDEDWTPIVGKTLLTTQAASLPSKSTSLSTYHTDSRYGTHVYRILNSTSSPWSGESKARHYYARQSSFNADGSMVLVVGSSRYFIIETTTWTLVQGGRSDGSVGQGSIGPIGPSEISWHPTDPNKLYFSPQTMLWYEYNVSAQTNTVYRNLTGRLGAHGMGSATHCTTGGEGRPSDDGRYWGLMVKNGSTQLGYICWDFHNDVIVGSMISSVSANNVTMSSSGAYVIPGHSFSGTFAEAESSSALRGVRAYSRDFSSFTQLSSTAGHADPCTDWDGDDCYVGVATLSFQGMVFGDCFMRKCSGGMPVKLYNKGENNANQQHISGSASPDRPGWIIISTYSEASSTESGWGDNGIFAVKLASPTEIRRIAHYRMMPVPAANYWDEPHATVSRDGLSVIFASRWRTSLGGTISLAKQESFVVGLPSWFYGGSPPTSGGSTNELTNGDFSSGSTGWGLNTGWSIASGVASKAAGSGGNVYQDFAFETGETYEVTYTINSISGGTVNCRFVNGTVDANVTGTSRSTPGTYTQQLVAGDHTRFAINGGAATVCEIDNIEMVKL